MKAAQWTRGWMSVLLRQIADLVGRRQATAWCCPRCWSRAGTVATLQVCVWGVWPPNYGINDLEWWKCVAGLRGKGLRTSSELAFSHASLCFLVHAQGCFGMSWLVRRRGRDENWSHWAPLRRILQRRQNSGEQASWWTDWNSLARDVGGGSERVGFCSRTEFKKKK